MYRAYREEILVKTTIMQRSGLGKDVPLSCSCDFVGRLDVFSVCIVLVRLGLEEGRMGVSCVKGNVELSHF
jgi:hypothetical protein